MARRSRSAAPRGELRIIGGRWRGRRIAIADVQGLRPTGDRIRETLFNWLAPEIEGARCLDLFAGTGALGLEALSRGAAAVDFVERSAPVAGQLRATLTQLEAGPAATVHRQDALAFLRANRAPYDLILVDPPFAADLWTPILEALPAHLATRGQVYLETPAAYSPILDPQWCVQREKRAGGVSYRLLNTRRVSD